MLMRSIKWSSLKAWGMRLMKTKGRRRAIVAVARKIAVVLHRMWVDGTEFRLGSSRADDGMDEAKNACCASSAPKSEALRPRSHACVHRLRSQGAIQTAKRSVIA